MDRKKLYGLIIVGILLGAAVIGIVAYRPKEAEGLQYRPSTELPEEYIILVDEPHDMDESAFIACLSSLAVHNGFHPLLILEEGELNMHQLSTIEQLTLNGAEDATAAPKLLFTDDDALETAVASQVENVVRYPMDPMVLAQFKGYADIMTVASYEEAMWAAPVAAVENAVMVLDESRPTFTNQTDAWAALRAHGIEANYTVVANPYDLSTKTLEENVEAYDTYDSNFHIDALSVMAPTVAAYHRGYVITEIEPNDEGRSTLGNMDFTLNARAIGYYDALIDLNFNYGPLDYVGLVGSAAAVSQFQLPGNGDGDVLVNCDVIYGFLEEEWYHMDTAVGRLVNWNLAGLSNQLARTYQFDHIQELRTVEYTGGAEEVNWKKKGASFSGYEITYERLQATPARFICKDFEDEGFAYEYYGPSGSGVLIGDGVVGTAEPNMHPILESSSYVAYRGHGSDYGSLYSVRVYGPNGEEGKISSEEVREMDLPPQTAFFVSCQNAKIHGTGYGEDAEDVEMDRLFATSYLYGGAVAVGGATEVSYSNIGQDFSAGTEEHLPGIINPAWSDGDYEWDLNDAIYAFWWDGILNTEEEYGTIGHAMRWIVNRYMNNPNRDYQISPFESTEESGRGGHWKETAMFAVYGDPAHRPAVTLPGENSYNPWKNGAEDGEIASKMDMEAL